MSLPEMPLRAGVHILTPEILGVIEIDGRPVEVSTGIGLLGERLFGLTWPRVDGLPDERDRLFHSILELVGEVVAAGGSY